MASLIHWGVTHLAPIFLITSPITSYADQIHSIHRTRSSAGFSLDIPLIMLVASVLKVYYWISEPYETSLLIQALVMIVMQCLLLHVALAGRSSAASTLHTPFADGSSSAAIRRPYDFWQWKPTRPYWLFIAYFTVALAVAQVLLGGDPVYTALQGYVALSIEATLPLPQILSNQQARSCKGFRLSVLVNWLIGDTFKMAYFFTAETDIPWAFKLCGIFQAMCDAYLGVQYLQFGEGESSRAMGASGGATAMMPMAAVPRDVSTDRGMNGGGSNNIDTVKDPAPLDE